MSLVEGVLLGQRITPLDRVGLYVPGGTAAYPSSVVMNVIPAQVAGVERIVVTTPPRTLSENPAVAAALFAFFQFAPVGKAIRACADNYTGALVVGLDVHRLYALSFGLGAACVGAAGAIIVLIVDVTPPLGPAYTLLAFVIVITGGLGSMPGALLGGVLIGLTEALAGLFFTPSAKSMFAFAILVLVLLFRPQGIMGKKLT